MLANELFREFFFSHYTPNVLDVVYGMTPEFKQELNKEYDIYTTNQLIAAYGKFNFHFPICEKLFKNTPEDFVELFFLKLKNQGIQIPPFQGRVELFSPSGLEEEKGSKKGEEVLSISARFDLNYCSSKEMIDKGWVRGDVEICQGCGKIKLNLNNEPRDFGCYGCSTSDDEEEDDGDKDEDDEDEDLILDDEGEIEEEISYYLGERIDFYEKI